MSTTETLLMTLLGAVLGGGVVLAWAYSELAQRRRPVEDEPVVSPGVATVLSVLRSGTVLVDEKGAVVKASALTHALGLVRDGDIVVPELAQMVREVRRDGEVRETDLTITQDRDPVPRYVFVRVAQLSSTLVLVLAEDRTRERRVEAVRRDFVANVSHELKTPVGAIRLLAEAVDHAAGDAEAVARFAGRMQTESERLSRLVQQIIELSRLQGDDPLESPVTVEVDKILGRAMDESSIDAQARGITVARGGEHHLAVLGNEEQIAVAVGNLVANAVTYSREGATVAIGAKAHEDTVDITVTDQGIGIPAGELDRIFERFYRVDPARHRSTGGTGLGLSIVKHVAASHGGHVGVWSVEGQGSTFTLTLPRKKQEQP